MEEILSVVLNKENETDKSHGNSLQTPKWRMKCYPCPLWTCHKKDSDQALGNSFY